ncbi:MAG: hypothetical protein QMD50_01380 [Patescibacteria group bacterium]|nr:hypothetical protein [Patescibacteria group bacterium]
MFLKTLNIFLGIIIIGFSAFFLQETGILAIYGINPNLILIIPLLVIFFQQNFYLLFFSLITFILIFFMFILFWLPALFILEGLIIIFYFFKKILTGNKLIDFSIGIIFITISFYFIMAILGGYNFLIWPAIAEIFYNLIVGLILWFSLSKILNFYEKKT